MGTPLRWRHNGRNGVSNHQPHDCLLNRLFRRRSKKTSKLRVTGLWAWNSPGTGEFPAQMASNAENVSIWWRHHAQISFWGTRTSNELRWYMIGYQIGHYSGVIMSAMARLYAEPSVQAHIKENIKAPRHWPLWPVDSPHKGPATRKMFPLDDVVMVNTRCPFDWHVLTLIPAWISNYSRYKVWDDITYPCQ